MYNFIREKREGFDIREEDIANIEEKYNIKFPDILKEYYLEHNGDRIKLCNIGANNTTYGMFQILPLKFGTITVESKIDNFCTTGIVDKDMVPFGYNEGGDDFFWNKKNENVYLYYWDDVKNPIFICDSIKSLFELMEKSVLLYQRGLI